jgi:hypothetical protein
MLRPGLPAQYQTRVHERRYRVLEEQREEYIEIFRRSDRQLVTLLDVVSPSNKTTAAGREAYLSTRQQARAAGANLVEMDLVLQGQPMLDYSRENLPAWDYAVTVTRAPQPERHEIYTSSLQKRLPRFRVPLAATDRDTVLDLQAAFERCYWANFSARINYRNAPAVPLSKENQSWLDELLLAQRVRRQQIPSMERGLPRLRQGETLHDRIAVAAYHLWQQEGCPHGRDKEYWYKAVEQLRGPAESE